MSSTGNPLKLPVAALAGVLGLVLIPGPAGASHSEGQGPKNQFVRGSSHRLILTTDQRWDQHINATSDPSGADARGHFFFPTDPPPDGIGAFSGRVTCLRVDGNEATAGGEIEHSNNPFVPEGAGFTIWVQDNGEPGDTDRSIIGVGFAPGPVCPPFLVGDPLSGGNYVVHDVVP